MPPDILSSRFRFPLSSSTSRTLNIDQEQKAEEGNKSSSSSALRDEIKQN